MPAKSKCSQGQRQVYIILEMAIEIHMTDLRPANTDGKHYKLPKRYSYKLQFILILYTYLLYTLEQAQLVCNSSSAYIKQIELRTENLV